MYVLDNAVQSGQGAPELKTRSRLGVYLGPSPNHARSVAQVLNPRTSHVSPQFHIRFDGFFFGAVQSKSTDLDAPDPKWKYLSRFATKKETAKPDAKGGLDGLLAPQRGTTAASSPPQDHIRNEQPAGPHQDLPMPLETDAEEHNQPAPQQRVVPVAARPLPQQETMAATACQT